MIVYWRVQGALILGVAVAMISLGGDWLWPMLYGIACLLSSITYRNSSYIRGWNEALDWAMKESRRVFDEAEAGLRERGDDERDD